MSRYLRSLAWLRRLIVASAMILTALGPISQPMAAQPATTTVATSATIWGVDAATLTAFDNAYWASQPTAVQALKSRTNVDAYAIIGNALALVRQGYLIDQEIMAYGSDPYCQMLARKNFGYAWWVNATQSVPGNATNGYADPGVKPPGALLVSINPADFPAFVDPSKAPAPPASVVGNDLGFTISGSEVFAAGVVPGIAISQQPKFADGQRVTVASGSYVYHVLNSGVIGASERVAVWLKQ